MKLKHKLNSYQKSVKPFERILDIDHVPDRLKQWRCLQFALNRAVFQIFIGCFDIYLSSFLNASFKDSVI